MKYLIVSADDFGLTKSMNAGIAKALKEGIATLPNAMPAGEAFDDAVEIAKDLRLEEAAAHLCLTETAPLSEAASIPTLVDKDGRFYRDHNDLLMKFMMKAVDRDDVYTELKRQMEEVKRLGVRITSLSSHEHVHMLPGFLEIFVRIAKEYGVPAIRYPHRETVMGKFSPRKAFRALILSFFEKDMERILGESGMRHADHFAGFLDSGRMTEDSLMALLRSMKDGVTELVCHPGFLGPEILDRYRFHINCEQELFALTSPRVKKLVTESGIRLIPA